MVKSYKEQFTLDQRIIESNRVLAKYPDKIPIIIECRNKELSNIIQKKKFLVPSEITFAYLLQIIRGKTKIGSDKALFIFINNRLISSQNLVEEVYCDYIKNKLTESGDKFLYLDLAYENTFG